LSDFTAVVKEEEGLVEVKYEDEEISLVTESEEEI